MEEVKFINETPQESTNVKVTREPPGPDIGDSPEVGLGDLNIVEYIEPIFGFIDLEVTVELFWGSPTKITVENISTHTLSSMTHIPLYVFITDGIKCFEWDTYIEIPSPGKSAEKDVPSHEIVEVTGWEVTLDPAWTYIDSNRNNNTQMAIDGEDCDCSDGNDGGNEGYCN